MLALSSHSTTSSQITKGVKAPDALGRSAGEKFFRFLSSLSCRSAVVPMFVSGQRVFFTEDGVCFPRNLLALGATIFAYDEPINGQVHNEHIRACVEPLL